MVTRPFAENLCNCLPFMFLNASKPPHRHQPRSLAPKVRTQGDQPQPVRETAPLTGPPEASVHGEGVGQGTEQPWPAASGRSKSTLKGEEELTGPQRGIQGTDKNHSSRGTCWLSQWTMRLLGSLTGAP